MECQVALAPELGINAFQFITAWNQTALCRAAAQARLSSLAGASGVVFDPSRLVGNTAVLSRLAVDIDAALLYDLLVRALVSGGVHNPIRLDEHRLADGTRLVTVFAA